MNLSTEHKALFSLLRAGLWEREPDDLSPFPLTDAQWWEVYRMSVRQTVAGIVFRGLHHLPEEYLPADALMIHWVAKADRIERKNRRMDAALRLLLQRMGREGLHPLLLKGQGVAALYEHPLLRHRPLFPLGEGGARGRRTGAPCRMPDREAPRRERLLQLAGSGGGAPYPAVRPLQPAAGGLPLRAGRETRLHGHPHGRRGVTPRAVAPA